VTEGESRTKDHPKTSLSPLPSVLCFCLCSLLSAFALPSASALCSSAPVFLSSALSVLSFCPLPSVPSALCLLPSILLRLDNHSTPAPTEHHAIVRGLEQLRAAEVADGRWGAAATETEREEANADDQQDLGDSRIEEVGRNADVAARTCQ